MPDDSLENFSVTSGAAARYHQWERGFPGRPNTSGVGGKSCGASSTAREWSRSTSISQRLRKALSKLRQALREAEVDAHPLIVRGGGAANPEYTMVPPYAE